MKKHNFFRILHNFLLAIRQSLANIIFVVLVILALIYSQYILAFFKVERPDLPKSFTLRIGNGEPINEETTVLSLEGLLRNANTSASVHQLTSAIRLAIDDPSVVNLWLDFDDLEISSFGVAEEIYEALLEFKTSGKPIYATGTNYDKIKYMLATLANEIWLDPMGSLDIQSFTVSKPFFAQALKKVGIEANIFRVGRFKDAIEGYELATRSEASREMTLSFLNSLWQRFTQLIFEQRANLTAEQQQAVLNPSIEQWFSGGSLAQAALSLGLIDSIGNRQEALNSIFKDAQFDSFGTAHNESVHFINHERYMDSILSQKSSNFVNSQNEIALVIATGTIISGHSEEGFMGSRTVSDNLAQVINDNTKAIVLRIDSGGGSSYASEEIYRLLSSIKQEKNIPIVISMGSTAASGAYWISLAGDEIVAHPTTITGSIGVFASLMTAEEFGRRWGISEDVISVPNDNNLSSSLFNRPSQALSTFLERSVNFTYNQFLQKVVDANRAQSLEAAHQIAQGRVYTGVQALDLKLVDHLGGLRLAIERAATLADIQENDYVINFYQESPSSVNQILQSLINNIQSSEEPLLEYLGQITKILLHDNDNSLYALETIRVK